MLAMIGPSKRAAKASPSASPSMMRMGVLVSSSAGFPRIATVPVAFP